MLTKDRITEIYCIADDFYKEFASAINTHKIISIETINDELKNICEVEHTRHRSIHNFIMNLIATLAVYFR